jgi:hypothetical protein
MLGFHGNTLAGPTRHEGSLSEAAAPWRCNRFTPPIAPGNRQHRFLHHARLVHEFAPEAATLSTPGR